MPRTASISSDEAENSRAGLKAWWAAFKSRASPSAKRSYLSPSEAGPSAQARNGTSVSASSVLSGGSSAVSASGAGSSGGSGGAAIGIGGKGARVFGVPLRTSLKYASVAISMAGPDGNQYVWGYIPAVVAKLGLYLKENATEVEGVFRIAGSQKRMKELQELFERPPKYGKNVDWTKTAYSVHDAASVLRRYLNHMPEPIVPLHLYSEFRNVMVKKPFDPEAAIKTYRLLIQSSPPANQYLLLYVLDLLAVFARKSDKNLMTAANLAVIFQPGMFSHPSHLTSADEHQTAVQVLEFLIEHQDHFVLGLSPPPPPHVKPEDLTAVSRVDTAAGAVSQDALELSDSDEDLGELEAHEGGGAKLARRVVLTPAPAEGGTSAGGAGYTGGARRGSKGTTAGFLAAAVTKLAHTSLVPPPSSGGSAPKQRQNQLSVGGGGGALASTDMRRSASANSAAEHGTFYEGRDVGGPADVVFGGRISPPSNAGSASPPPSLTGAATAVSAGRLQRSASKGGARARTKAVPAEATPEDSCGAGGSPARGAAGIRRSKTTPTKKSSAQSSGNNSGASSPRNRRKQKEESAAGASADASPAAAATPPVSQAQAASTTAAQAAPASGPDTTSEAARSGAEPPTTDASATKLLDSTAPMTTDASAAPP